MKVPYRLTGYWHVDVVDFCMQNKDLNDDLLQTLFAVHATFHVPVKKNNTKIKFINEFKGLFKRIFKRYSKEELLFIEV